MTNTNDHDNDVLWTGLGAVAAVFLCSLGAAIASTAAAPYAMLSSSSSLSMVPLVQAAVLGSYGVMIAIAMLVWHPPDGDKDDDMAVLTSSSSMGYRHLAAGLVVGLSCVVSGATMRSFVSFLLVPDHNANDAASTKQVVGDDKPRVRPLTPKAIGLMIFMEVFGLYGFAIALLLIFWPQKAMLFPMIVSK